MNSDRIKPYRCTIPPEDCACRLRVGRKDVVCELIDLSREDFRIRVPKKHARVIRRARRLELRYHGERWLVKLAPTQEDQPDIVSLLRINELTPVNMPSPWATLGTMRMSRETDPRFVLALMLALIAACVSLPGIGDQLGTAPRIKDGVHSVLRSFK